MTRALRLALYIIARCDATWSMRNAVQCAAFSWQGERFLRMAHKALTSAAKVLLFVEHFAKELMLSVSGLERPLLYTRLS